MAILSEFGARKLLGHVEHELRECVTVAWARWVREVKPLLPACSARGRANIVWEFMVEEARRRFPNVPVSEAEGRFVLLFHQQLNVLFKKLSEDGLPRNYPTQTALEFAQQPELPGMFDFARVTVGYELNRLGTGLASVSASCLDGPAVRWRFELSERPAKIAIVPSQKKQAPAKEQTKRVRRKPTAADNLRVIKGGRTDNDS